MRPALLLPLAVLAVAGCRPMDVGAPIADAASEAEAPANVDLRGGRVRVIDGDTFELDGETVRISNIDTPETPPRSRCLAESRLAVAAKTALADVMALQWAIDPVLVREGRDRYGRTLARVSVAEVDVGSEMIRRGFAEPWTGRRADWCSEFQG